MTTDPDDDTARLAPDRAFAVLGNETRIRTLQALGDADGPLSFTELRDRVGMRQGEQFNYHLSKLVGHFVEKSEAGYLLRRPGQRVTEAVLSGAVTEDPKVDRTLVTGWSCPYCSGPVEVSYEAELVERYCTECPGLFAAKPHPGAVSDDTGRGYLGALHLPPAGVVGRSADELLAAAFTWGYWQWLLAAKGVCPRCSARVHQTVAVCEDHDDGQGLCGRCGARHAVKFRTTCENCLLDLESVISMHLAADPALLSFALDHSIDPLSEPWDWGWEYEEEILSTNPFRGRFTFCIERDEVSVTVDEDLDVVDVSST